MLPYTTCQYYVYMLALVELSYEGLQISQCLVNRLTTVDRGKSALHYVWVIDTITKLSKIQVVQLLMQN